MKCVLIFLAIALISTNKVLAQAPPIPVSANLAPVTDLGSYTGSLTANGNYIGLNVNEGVLGTSVRNYVSVYNERTKYYAGILIVHKINNEIEKVEDRYKELSEENEELHMFLHYSKRKENEKKMEEISQQILTLKDELKDQYNMVILGEKVNLYQNVMRTLTPIRRKLDTLEGNINRSNLLKELIETIKD